MVTSGEKPSARNNHCSCSFNEFIYIHGGHDGIDWLDDFYILDTNKCLWNRIITENYTPKPRACHTLSRIGRKLYLYGGYDGNQSFSNFEVFNLDTQMWSSLYLDNNLIDNPSPRNAHTATVINKKIFIFGGHYQNTHLNDLIIFDSITNNWITPILKGVLPPGMRGHSSNFIFNNLYFFGGYDGKVRNNDIYRLHLDDFSFIKFQNNKENIFPRQRHSSITSSDNKILFFGGFDGIKWLNNLEELNIPMLENNLAKQISLNKFIGNFKNMINNEEFSDIIFRVKNNDGFEIPIYAHKFILFTRCEYFRNMFSDHMIEKNSDELLIENFQHKYFLLFLEFLYTSNISFQDSNSMIKLYEIADAYSCEILKKYCEDVLSLLLKLENLLDILIIAHKLNSTSLEKLAIDFISFNRKEVLANCNFNILNDYPTLMLKILKNLQK